MTQETDLQLLERHRSGEADAFGELVARHIDWVYSAAKRRAGAADLPDDITQAVFIALAKRPPRTLPHGTASPWLFGTLLRTCKAALRAKATRRRHETEAAKMRPQTLESPANAQWSDIAPHLEEMVNKLRTSDREIVLLRFYEQKSFSEIAETIGITEDAARKRVSRSVEALRGVLSRRGVSVPAAALAGVLVAETVKPAPTAIASIVDSPTTVSKAMGAALEGAKIMSWFNIKQMVGVAVLVLVMSGAVIIAVSQRSFTVPPAQAATAPPGRVGLAFEKMVTGPIRVISVSDGGPAASAGVVPGDIIVSVDGTTVDGFEVPDVLKMMSGSVGTQVVLVVRHAEGKLSELRIVRDSFPSVSDTQEKIAMETWSRIVRRNGRGFTSMPALLDTAPPATPPTSRPANSGLADPWLQDAP